MLWYAKKGGSMTLEILAKSMPMYKSGHDLIPVGVASVWTPVRLKFVVPSGITRWRIVGGLYSGYIVYTTKEDKGLFMVPDLQGQNEAKWQY